MEAHHGAETRPRLDHCVDSDTRCTRRTEYTVRGCWTITGHGSSRAVDRLFRLPFILVIFVALSALAPAFAAPLL